MEEEGGGAEAKAAEEEAVAAAKAADEEAAAAAKAAAEEEAAAATKAAEEEAAAKAAAEEEEAAAVAKAAEEEAAAKAAGEEEAAAAAAAAEEEAAAVAKAAEEEAAADTAAEAEAAAAEEEAAEDAQEAAEATATTGIKEFVIFNNGSAGDGDATFSFGGSHSDDFSEVEHGENQYVLKKFEAVKVSAVVGSLLIGTIPDGPPVVIACPVEAGHNNPFFRDVSVAWEGSEQEDLANAMEAPQEAVDAVKALVE